LSTDAPLKYILANAQKKCYNEYKLNVERNVIGECFNCKYVAFK
jgi:hypothetical protein